MSEIIQACLYNSDPESSQELTEHISALNFVRLSSEVGTEDELASVFAETEPKLVFFHLGPDPSSVLAVIEQVSARYPDVAMIAISEDTRPHAILEPIRAGCDQFVCKPVDPTDLANAVSRVASKRLFQRTTSKCICVGAASGGVGATSIACNLALEIAYLTRKKCALVDLDLQFGDLALFFDCETQYTIFDLADTGSHFDQTVLENVLTKLPDNVVLLPRPERVEQCQSIGPEVIHHTIDLLASTYEHVVVDLPRHLNPCTFAALGQADIVLIVCQLLVPSIRNATRFFESLVHAGIPEDRIEVIVNRSDSSGGRVTAKDLEETIKKPVYASIPSDYQFVARSLDFGQPIASVDRGNAVRKAIGKIARSIVGDAAVAEVKEGRRGLLGRLLSKT